MKLKEAMKAHASQRIRAFAEQHHAARGRVAVRNVRPSGSCYAGLVTVVTAECVEEYKAYVDGSGVGLTLAKTVELAPLAMFDPFRGGETPLSPEANESGTATEVK